MKSLRYDIPNNRTLKIQGNTTIKRRFRAFFSFSTFLLFAICIFTITNCQDAPREDLGTYEDPKKALIETQKVFTLLSSNLNKGYESVHYINEYEIAKDKIFNVD